MKRATLFGVLVVTLAAGCGSSARVDHGPPLVVRGSLVVGIQYREAIKHRLGQLFGGRVVIFSRHGARVGILHIKDGHTATAKLPPGDYSVGYGRGHPTARQLGGCPPQIASVSANNTTHYTLVLGCSIR